MPNASFLQDEVAAFRADSATAAGGYLASFIGEDAMIGDLLALDYDEADVLVHDHMRQKVGGLPMGCFLLSTRLVPMAGSSEKGPDAEKEDTALILLRVVGRARLSNHSDTEKYRLDAALRSIDSGQTWDAENKTDQFTLNQLRHAGVHCSVLGTFRMQKHEDEWHLGFGADISNFYSGQGMKVYKPMGESLRKIVNFSKLAGDRHPLAGKPVEIGRVRYSSSEIEVSDERENVSVGMDPTDLLARRMALFGMSRSGKSNTIKTVAAAIFKLRAGDPEKGRVGQLVLDLDGEYCNDNPQDSGCLRNVWRSVSGGIRDDVVTYGLHSHPNDKERRLMKVNFFGKDPEEWSNREDVEVAMDMLLAGRSIIDESLQMEGSIYVRSFLKTSMELPREWGRGDQLRYRRRIVVYRALLAGAGFRLPAEMERASIAELFGKDTIIKHLVRAGYHPAAETLGGKHVTWQSLLTALESLQKFLSSNEGKEFNAHYSEKVSSTGDKWSDDELDGLLSLLGGPAGLARLRWSQDQHSADVSRDYAAQIVDELVGGRLVIVDQSTGAPDLIQRASDRIMWELFDRQKGVFISPHTDKSGNIVPPPDVIVCAEEAHNLLPAKNADLTSVWARTAKEGSKFRIGLVYSTQEPSSILANILKNTDNWFVAHLNNQDETRELKKYYDFEMFEGQILKVPDTGFVRMRCLSNPYIVPVQVNRFEADTVEGG